MFQIQQLASKMDEAHLHVLFFCSVAFLVVPTQSVLRVPGLLNRKNYAYTREADVNIGHLVSIYQLNDHGDCSELKPNRIAIYKAIDYAIDEINQRRDILPNITVGFVQLMDCNDDLKALEVAVYLVPDESCDGRSKHQCGSLVANADNLTNGLDNIQPFNVVGIVGPVNSVISVAVSKLLGTFQLPVVATYATANELSDKTKYPYFMRLVPPDLAEEKTIIEVQLTPI